MVILWGFTVRGRLEDGTIFDSSTNHGPVGFTIGEGQ